MAESTKRDILSPAD